MNKPLWMPKGSVRSIMALACIGGSIAGWMMGMTVPEWLIGLDGTIAALYFEHRRNGHD